MFWSRKESKEDELAVESKLIQEEIERSKRFKRQFGVLAVELSHSAPRGLSRVMPGKTISFHVLEKHLRGYDKVVGPVLRRYYIILPETDEAGVGVVKDRLEGLAQEEDWGPVDVGMSVYPKNGKTAKALLDAATDDLPA